MSGTRWRALRPVPRLLGVGLTAAAAVFAAVTGFGTGHGGLQLLSGVLLCATALRALERRREVPSAPGRESTSRSRPTPVPTPARSPEPRLGEKLRLSLQVLGHVGQEMADMDGRRLAGAAEVVREESERLVGVVDEMVGPDSFGTETPVDMEGLLEELLAVHRPLLQALDVQVRVMLGHRRGEVSGERGSLLEALGALLRHTLTQIAPEASVQLRTREVAGLFSLQLTGSKAEESVLEEPLEVEQARQVLALHGGEIWADEDAGCGFGLSLPLRGHRSVAQPVEPFAVPA